MGRYRRSGCVKGSQKKPGPLSALKSSHERPRTPGLPIKTRHFADPSQDGVSACSRTRKKPRLTQFKDLGLNASILKALTDKGYTDPTPIQVAGHPRRAWTAATCSASPRPAPARPPPSPCRSFTASPPTGSRRRGAAAAASCCRRRASWRPRSPRASAPMARSSASPSPTVFGGVGHGPQSAGAGARRRRPRRDARPPARPSGRARCGPLQRRDLRPRRGRPDARHGLHRADPADRETPAEAAPEPVLLGHHADRHRQAGRRAAARSGARSR